MGWRNRDWIWLLVFTVFTHGFLFVNKSIFMDMISYASTFVSISLAGIAIYISIREVTKTDNLKDEMYKLLGELNEKIGQVDVKLNNIDPMKLNESIETTMENLNSEIHKVVKDNLNKLSTSDSKENLEPAINEIDQTIKDFSNVLKSTISIQTSEKKEYDPDSKFFAVYNLFSNEETITPVKVQQKLNRIFGTFYSQLLINSIMSRHRNLGYLIPIDGETNSYKKTEKLNT